MSMSCFPGEASSRKVRIGTRRLVTNGSPIWGKRRPLKTRVCSALAYSWTSAALKASRSPHCLPSRSTQRNLVPGESRTPRPSLAGTTIRFVAMRSGPRPPPHSSRGPRRRPAPPARRRRHLEECVRDGVVHQVPGERAQGGADETGVESTPLTPAAEQVLDPIDRLVVVGIVERELAGGCQEPGKPEESKQRVIGRELEDRAKRGAPGDFRHRPAAGDK